MEILRGAPALSEFRVNKLLALSDELNLNVSAIYAEFVHFADLTAQLSTTELTKLNKLLTYGPTIAEHQPSGKLLLVTPRPGTISPWSSKATDIAHNCGLNKVKRLERGIAYYVESDALTTEQEQALTALLHDRMVEVILAEFEPAAVLFVRT
ncbi:MAG: phosphoribosylformylglycinamidine synthase, partial [Gammaproteobacteria bacterium]|nr:phosphoribosylformylglycinamidine synthase [Gammaproteobacteria bacterium]